MTEDIIKKLYSTRTRATDVFEYNIILNTDVRLFNAMLVLIYSASVNLKKPINLFVLQADFPQFRKDELKSYCNSLGIRLNIVDIDVDRFKDFLPGRLPKAGSFYLLAHELLPASCDRALYIDIDTMVLKDIAKFYNVEFENTWLAACQEYDNGKVRDYLIAKRDGKDPVFKHLYCSDCLFNGGVQVLNLDKFRKERVTLDDFIKLKNPNDTTIGLVIQPIVNRFANINIKVFPKLYYNCWSANEDYFRKCFNENDNRNEVYSHYKINEDEVNSIIHFAGVPNTKPWHALCGIDANGKPELIRGLNKFQIKHIREWWDYAQHIPPKNYAELLGETIAKPISANRDLVRIQTLKLLNEMTKKNVKLKREERVRQDWKFLQYPVSEETRLHFEYSLSQIGLQIAFHIEYELEDREKIIREVMALDNTLKYWHTRDGVGCYYINEDLRDSAKSVILMKKLMELAEPILCLHGLT